MTEIRVETLVPYSVAVGCGAADSAAGFIRSSLRRAGKVAVVTDTNVEPLHAGPVLESLAAAGLETHKFAIPAGERSKNLGTYSALVGFLAGRRLDRSDAVLALGGGVVGDIAGFAAATYRRGIDFVQVPTTLLAMVDSSVGGKTGVDVDGGKNLVGAFHQPRAVFCDLRFLATLPEQWRMDGMGEVLKYAILGDAELFARLERAPLSPIGEAEIAACIAMKRDIVEKDEKESGARKLLNLGHTFGHAIEKLSGFAVSHGRAVTAGVAMAARAARNFGILPDRDSARIEALAAAMGGDLHMRLRAADVAEAILSDKKVEGDSIDLVLPQSIGRCTVRKTPLSGIGKVVADVL